MSTTTEKAFSKHTSEFNGKTTELGRDLKDISKITGAIASDAVHLAQETATQLYDKGVNNASEYYDQGVKQAKKIEKRIESKIKENPLQALLVAAGVGLVLGAVWKHR